MRVVVAAAELFATEGYARTTLGKIAHAAGVSTETVQGQGPKAALMIAAVEYTAFGVSGEEHVFNLAEGRRLLAVEDSAAAAEVFAEMQADIFQRIGQLAQALIGAATADPELDRFLADMFSSVELQIRRILGMFGERGWLRHDIPFDELVETVAVVGGVETYLHLTRRAGWTAAAYREWLQRMLGENVLRTVRRTSP
jgi:AcrR family transcriptional regulator